MSLHWSARSALIGRESVHEQDYGVFLATPGLHSGPAW